MMRSTKSEGTGLGWVLSRANNALKTTVQTATDVLRGISDEHARHVQERMKALEEQRAVDPELVTESELEAWEVASHEQAVREEAEWAAECARLLVEVVDQLQHHAQGCNQGAETIAEELFYYDSAPFVYSVFEQDFEMRAFSGTHPFSCFLGLAASQEWEEIGDPMVSYTTPVGTAVVVWWEEHVKRGVARLTALLEQRGMQVARPENKASASVPAEDSKKEDGGDSEDLAVRPLATEIYAKVKHLGQLSGLDVPARSCFLYDCFSDTAWEDNEDQLWWFSCEHPYVMFLDQMDIPPQLELKTQFGDFRAYLESDIDRYALGHVEQIFSEYELEWGAVVLSAPQADGASVHEESVIPDPAIPVPSPIYRPPQILTLPAEAKKGR